MGLTQGGERGGVGWELGQDGVLVYGDENEYVCMTKVEESQSVDVSVSASVHGASECMYRQKAL